MLIFLKKVKIICKKFGKSKIPPYLCIVLGEKLTQQTNFQILTNRFKTEKPPTSPPLLGVFLRLQKKVVPLHHKTKNNTI